MRTVPVPETSRHTAPLARALPEAIEHRGCREFQLPGAPPQLPPAFDVQRDRNGFPDVMKLRDLIFGKLLYLHEES